MSIPPTIRINCRGEPAFGSGITTDLTDMDVSEWLIPSPCEGVSGGYHYIGQVGTLTTAAFRQGSNLPRRYPRFGAEEPTKQEATIRPASPIRHKTDISNADGDQKSHYAVLGIPFPALKSPSMATIP